MRAVIQRVSGGAVGAPGREKRTIGPGLVVLLGVGLEDEDSDVSYMADKIVNLRIFQDRNDKMNLSLLDTGGEMLVVSQFTLYGDCRSGRRPGFSEAAPPDLAQKLYADFVREVNSRGVAVRCGYFREHMRVEIINDGPVTMLLESKKSALI
ncbi:MAG: D-aminoacyl-tRNA deacylase [Firmicutes bacterium]|nr:D-aminoacyl-tRNA deacylase [Bacillota bacterium]